MKFNFKNINLKKLFDNDQFVRILSLVAAVFLWMFTVNAVDSDSTLTVHNVPVEVNVEESALGSMGLDTINGRDYKANVTIRGERNVIGGVEPEDIQVYAVLSNLSGPGNYDIRLEARDRNGMGFTIKSVEPNTVKMQFDRLVTKKLPVQVELTGVSIPDGYLLESESVNPREVTVTGPEADMLRVYRCVVKAEVNRELSKTETIRTKIELQDQDGKVVESKYINLDTSTAEVTIPVLKKKEVPVKVEFLNVPPEFPLDELQYTYSQETIEIAGPEEDIDNLSEIHLGYIDMKELGESGAYPFDVELPSGFINVENIETVVVEFEDHNLTTKNFIIRNITVINEPVNYDITVATRSISGVKMVGRKSVLGSMSAQDIVAEIDVSDREITSGQIKVPVRIYAPTKGLVWASGSYEAIITIKEK